MTDRRLLLLVTGTRRNGNSEALAARAAEALPDSHFRGEMNGESLWGVTSHAGPANLAEPLVGALRNTAAFMGMTFGGVLFGNATRPGRLAADPEAVARADRFFGSASPAGAAAGR